MFLKLHIPIQIVGNLSTMADLTEQRAFASLDPAARARFQRRPVNLDIWTTNVRLWVCACERRCFPNRPKSLLAGSERAPWKAARMPAIRSP
jgi:hypothetical protein